MKRMFFTSKGHKKVKIFLKDILYLNAFQDYTLIVTSTDKHYVLVTLGTLLKEMNFNEFIRVHKSYAVNKDCIKEVSSREIIPKTNISVPIGRSYKESLDHLK